MCPILFSVGPFEIRAYSVFVEIGILVAVFVAWREARRVGIRSEDLLNVAIYSIVAAILGSRIYYVLGRWPEYAGDWLRILNFREGGLVYHGGLFAGLAVAILYMLWRRISVWRLLDVAAPSLALGEAIARIGCLLNGCCYGMETDSWLGIYLPDLYGHWARRYPTQILQGLADLAIFAILWALRKRKPFDGFLILTYGMLYSLSRLGLESMRAENLTISGALTAQVVSAIVFVICAALSVLLWRRSQGQGASPMPVEGQGPQDPVGKHEVSES